MNDSQCKKQVEYEKKEQRRSKTLSDISETADTAAMVISTGEQWFADGIGVVFIVVGCFAGPEGCGAGAGMAVSADFLISSANPFAIIENFLGVVSSGSTMANDILTGDSKATTNKIYIGKDSLVSVRNALFGLIPESNIDSLVSQSQVQYDIDRANGTEKGGSVELSTSNINQLTTSLFLENTFWKSGWDTVTNFFNQFKK